MSNDQPEQASKYFQILTHLSEKSWENISEIARTLRMNTNALKNILLTYEKRDFVENFDSLSEEQKILEKKNSAKDFRQGNKYFRITELGREKIDNIQKICLDDDDQTMLKFKIKWS